MRIREKTGAALLTVLIAMMIITLMLFEFQYSSMIERKLAYNDLNQMQAYYLAKAGARMGLLRIALYGRMRASKDIQGFKNKGLDVGPYLEQIWQLPFPPFPPSAATVKSDKMLKADKDAAEKILEETRVSDGQSIHTIKSESSKLNLNYLVIQDKTQQTQRPDFNATPTTVFQYVGMMLVNILNQFLRESEKPYEEYPNMKPEDLVMDIMDWVNPGNSRLGGGSKDSFYEQQKPPYKAKKNRFYTVEELRLVRGIDEHLFSKLQPLVTVYSVDGKINLNTAGRDIYRALYRDFTDDDLKRIIEEREKRGGWAKEGDFISFATTDLNRPGFGTLYGNNKELPFTVGSHSFLIEATGMLTRSKSTIQKSIRIGVALAPARGGELTPETNPAVCNGTDPNTSATFWDSRYNQCRTKPNTKAECMNKLAGNWVDTPAGSGRFGCTIQNFAPAQPITIFPQGTAAANPAGGGGGAPGAPGTPGGGQGTVAAPEPNTMKILFWSES